MIEPLGIVNRQKNRSLRRQLRDQPQSGKTDQEDIGDATMRAEPKSHLQRIALRLWQLSQKTQRWKQELMQSGERKLSFGLHAVRAEHHHTERMRSFRGHCEHRRLADSCFPADNERSTMVRAPIDDPNADGSDAAGSGATPGSGATSGSGATPSPTTHHPVRAHNLRTYRPLEHQHTPEILETLSADESRAREQRRADEAELEELDVPAFMRKGGR